MRKTIADIVARPVSCVTAPTPRDEQIIADLKAGISAIEVAKRHRITKERVGQISGKWWKEREKIYPDRDTKFIAEARALWDKGFSMRMIGRHLGVTHNVIAGLRFRYKFPPRLQYKFPRKTRSQT